ncbi:MAG: DMT family transporter [Gammaproteobacteria bacterium]|jgi:drug/metabolite transporter (DMT)-like permease|nr:DMT family transporter [Gammaproteobacteria bacterium]
MSSISLRHWLLFASLTLLWGTSFLNIAISLRSFTPEQIVAWRLIFAALVLLLVVAYQNKRLPLALKDWAKFALFACLGNLLPYWLIAYGQQTVTSGMAGLLMAVMPLTTMVLAHWYIAGERLNRNRIIGFLMGILGVIFVLWPSLINGTNSWFGAVMILLAACSYAVNTILIRLYSHHDISVVSAGVMICAAIMGVIIWPQMWDVQWHNVGTDSLLSLVWLGLVPTGIASVIYFTLVQQAGPHFVSNNNYIIPVIAYLSGALILGEPVAWVDFFALAVILTGIGISRR